MGQSKSSMAKFCPPPGPSLPAPTQAAIENLKFDLFPDGSAFLPQVQNEAWYAGTTFSVQASIAGKTVFQHASYRTGKGIEVPSGDASTLFQKQTRIGSVSKAFTVMAILLSKDLIHWDDPITKFGPMLDKAYENVTIAALAGQTSGLGRYGYTGDLSVVPTFDPEMLGLPKVDEALPDCDPFPGGRSCSTEEELTMFNNADYHPLSPSSSPLYSNIAYNLLGIALEYVHAKPYDQIIDELIFQPMGMKHSGFATPNDTANAILPIKGETWFAAPFGNFDPSGGIWSTPEDHFAWTKSLLDNCLLTRAETRAWFQPSSSLPSLQQLVGAPWEIFRPTDLNIKTTRPVDIITKAGGITGYSAYSILVPEYNIAIAITAAGNDATAAAMALLPLVVKPIVAHADAQAYSQAAAKYAGTYSSSHSHSRVVVVADDGPGLALTTFTVNGIDMLQALPKVLGVRDAPGTARIYPADIDGFGANGTERWNILFDRKIEGDFGFAQMQCISWNWGDAAKYVGQPLDSIEFDIGERGNAAMVELLGWRTSLVRTA